MATDAATEVLGLRKSLKAEIQRNEMLQRKIRTLEAHYGYDSKDNLNQPNVSLFLTKLSREVGDQIYKLLLVNPDLAKASTIDLGTDWGANFKYSLTATLLRTCRIVHDEASAILYGCNVFYLECIGKLARDDSFVPCSPLTRYVDQGLYRFETLDFRTIPAMKRIRSWSVITCARQPSSYECPLPAEPLVRFCQAVCDAPVKAVQVVVILKSCNPGTCDSTQVIFSRTQLELLTKPLTMMRGLTNFSMRVALMQDVTNIVPNLRR